MTRFFAFAIVLFGALAASAHQSALQSQSAIRNEDLLVRLDTGGHTARVNRLAVSRDGSMLVSASNDGSVRLWRTNDGQLIKIFRGYSILGAGDQWAVDISPDNKWLLVGSDSDPRMTKVQNGRIRIFSIDNGEIVGHLEGHEATPLTLQFSPDGGRVISGDYAGVVVLWDFASRQPLAIETAHEQAKPASDSRESSVYRVAFLDSNDQWVSVGDDGTARLWSYRGEGRKTNSTTLQIGPTRIRSLAVFNNSTIATGDAAGWVRVFDLRSRQVLYSKRWNAEGIISSQSDRGGSENENKVRSIGALSFSRRDASLLIGTTGRAGPFQTRVWRPASNTSRLIKQNVDEVLDAVQFVYGADEFIAWTGGENHAIYYCKLEHCDNPSILVGAPTRTMVSLGFSADGRWLAWGGAFRADYRWKPNDFGDLDTMVRLPAHSSETLGMPTAIDTSKDWLGPIEGVRTVLAEVQNPKDSLEKWQLIVRDRGRIFSTITRKATDGHVNGYGQTVWTFIPGQPEIIAGGTNGALTKYSLNGDVLGEYRGHISTIYGIAIRGMDGLVATGSADRTINLWNSHTHELVASLFHIKGDAGGASEFLAWTPQGFYCGTENAGRLLGWQINRDPDSTARFETARSFRSVLNRCDIVQRAITARSARGAGAELAPEHNLSRLLAESPPKLALVRPARYENAAGGFQRVTLEVESGPSDRRFFHVFNNGRQVDVSWVHTPPAQTHDRRFAVEFDVPLQQGRNRVQISMMDGRFESSPVTFTVMHEREGPLDRKGALHILSIGISEYPGLPNVCGPNRNANCTLPEARNDADRFAKTAREEFGRGLGIGNHVVLRSGEVADRQPTVSNILSHLDRLADVNSIDTVAIFIAGHAERTDGGDLVLLAADTVRSRGDGPREGQNILPWREIEDRLSRIKGIRYLFIDSCHAGAAVQSRPFELRRKEGANLDNVIAFLASRRDELAGESASIGAGFFTASLTEGMRGAAAPSAKRITAYELFSYVSKKVDGLSRGAQSPLPIIPAELSDHTMVWR